MNITEIASNSFQTYAKQTLCKFFGSKLSYAEMQQLVHKIAAGLQQLGVKKGTQVGIYLPNIPIYVAIYHAILLIGGVAVNYSLLSDKDSFYQQIKSTDIKFLVTVNLKKLYDIVEPIHNASDTDFKLIICTFFEGISYWKDWIFWFKQYNNIATIGYDSTSVIKFSSLLNCGTNFIPVKIQDDDSAVVQFSGGTTGKPKGIVLSHSNIAACLTNLDELISKYQCRSQEILNVISVLPLNHVFSMMITMCFVVKYGLTTTLIPKFETTNILQEIQNEKINVLIFVPTLLAALVRSRDIKNYDLSSLKLVFCGGAALSCKLYKESKKLLPNDCDLFQGYGLSETCALVSLNSEDHELKPESVGKPVINTTISIRSLKDEAKELAIGEIGEICVQGPQIMKSYLDPKDNQGVFIDGYLRTGDIGFLSQSGTLNIIDRLKDIIVRRGYNIFPSEIEMIVAKHEAVEDIAIVGIKNIQINEEIPKAIIKLNSKYQSQDLQQVRDSIMEHCQKHLSPLKMPKIIDIVNDLPKTPIGKIDKKKLKLQELEKSNIQIK